MAESSGASRIVVAETGNKRTNISEQDVEQCVKDLAAWMETNAPSFYAAKLAPSQGAVDAAEVAGVLAEFSAGVSMLGVSLTKFNGGMQYLDTFVGLSVQEISALGAEKGLKQKQCVPFARDIDDSLLCVQVSADGSETVVSVDGADGSVLENLGFTYAQYIESIREKLLTRKIVYEEDLGLVQVA